MYCPLLIFVGLWPKFCKSTLHFQDKIVPRSNLLIYSPITIDCLPSFFYMLTLFNLKFSLTLNFYLLCKRTRKTEDIFSVATSNVEIGHNSSVANTNVVTGSLHKLNQIDEFVAIGKCKISRLLFADDFVLLAFYESGLKHALNGFAAACDIAIE